MPCILEMTNSQLFHVFPSSNYFWSHDYWPDVSDLPWKQLPWPDKLSHKMSQLHKIPKFVLGCRNDSISYLIMIWYRLPNLCWWYDAMEFKPIAIENIILLRNKLCWNILSMPMFDLPVIIKSSGTRRVSIIMRSFGVTFAIMIVMIDFTSCQLIRSSKPAYQAKLEKCTVREMIQSLWSTCWDVSGLFIHRGKQVELQGNLKCDVLVAVCFLS